MKNLPRFLVLLFCATLLSACALMKYPEKPEVSLADINLTKMGLLEQQFQLKMRVQNPNNHDLPIDGVSVQVHLNGEQFVTAVSNAPVNVPRFGSAMVTLNAVSTISTISNQIKNLLLGTKRNVTYTLTGKVHLSDPSVSLPIHKQGEVNLPTWVF